MKGVVVLGLPMFVDAIEKVAQFTRPIHSIFRYHGTKTATPVAATLFFVNDQGDAVTCKHVAENIAQTDAVNDRYRQYATEVADIRSRERHRAERELAKKFGLAAGAVVQVRHRFVNCVGSLQSFEIHLHPTLDLAIIRFKGDGKNRYSGHAVFQPEPAAYAQGKSACRLGFPFPEFTNFTYDAATDDIKWTEEGKEGTPRFPLDGIITRQLLDDHGDVFGIETSTPGLKGQSGGPLFDRNGIVLGMQFRTAHLHLGFDVDKEIVTEGRTKHVKDSAFLHVGHCIGANRIISFLKEKGVPHHVVGESP